MKTLLAYVIVLVFGQFLSTAGTVLVGAGFSLLLSFAPAKARGLLCGFIGGLAGSVLAVAFAYLVFRWIIGPESFGPLPLAASVVSLALPISKDIKKYLQLKRIHGEMDQMAAKVVALDLAAFGSNVIGEIAGIFTAAGFYLS